MTGRMLQACVAAALFSGCSSATPLSASRLESMGVREGGDSGRALQALAREGYDCFGADGLPRRFDCSRTTGSILVCVLRVSFMANEQNQVAELHVAEPACMGTP